MKTLISVIIFILVNNELSLAQKLIELRVTEIQFNRKLLFIEVTIHNRSKDTIKMLVNSEKLNSIFYSYTEKTDSCYNSHFSFGPIFKSLNTYRRKKKFSENYNDSFEFHQKVVFNEYLSSSYMKGKLLEKVKFTELMPNDSVKLEFRIKCTKNDILNFGDAYIIYCLQNPNERPLPNGVTPVCLYSENFLNKIQLQCHELFKR